MAISKPVAIITGGTRGIGLAIAQKLASEGYALSLLYRRQRKHAKLIAEQLSQQTDVLIHRGDVATPSTNQELVEATIAKFGRIDSVILNAASGVLQPMFSQDVQGWEWTMKINHLGPFLTLKAAEPHLNSGSTVVALSSLGSIFGIPNYGFVGQSKAAIEAFVRQAAIELGSRGININAVCAGAVPTDAIDHFPNGEEVLAAARRNIVSDQPLNLEDIANVVAWLCSQTSAGIQGQTIIVDRGHSLSLNAG